MCIRDSEEDAPVKSPWRAEVGLLDGSLELELGGLQAARQAALLAGAPLALDEQAEALGEGERRVAAALRLLGEGLGHRPEAQVVEPLDGLGVVHLLVSLRRFLVSRSSRRRAGWRGTAPAAAPTT